MLRRNPSHARSARMGHPSSMTHPSALLARVGTAVALRCLLDPWNNVYYSLPFVLTLVTWEGLCRRDRPPVVALLSTVLVWVTFVRAPEWMGPDMQSVVFLAWALPLAAWMARTAFAPAPAPAAAPAASRATPDPRAPLAGALAQRE